MPCTSHCRSIEVLVEPAIFKVKHFIYAPKYGFEKEALKNFACMLVGKKKNQTTVEVTFTIYQFCFNLQKLYWTKKKPSTKNNTTPPPTHTKNNTQKPNNLYVENST